METELWPSDDVASICSNSNVTALEWSRDRRLPGGESMSVVLRRISSEHITVGGALG